MRRASLAASGLLLLAALFVVPGLLDPFRLNLLGKYLCFALVALGLDLLWGYAGQLSLGQSVFFGLGAYLFGMYLKLESSGGKLPDFMSWSGLSELPAFWQPFANPVVALVAAVMIPGVLGAALGYLLSRSRIVGVYFAIITQALAFIATTLFIGQQPFTGGTNGLTNFSTIFGYSLRDPEVEVRMFQVTTLVLAGCLAFTLWLSRSRFGRLLVALRDDEQRVAVGGRGTLIGAVVGAIVVNAAQTAVSESLPDLWQYGIGALFVATVLVFPRGLVGSLSLWERAGVRAALGLRPHPRSAHPDPSSARFNQLPEGEAVTAKGEAVP
jgi:urea transport system permease protein